MRGVISFLRTSECIFMVLYKCATGRVTDWSAGSSHIFARHTPRILRIESRVSHDDRLLFLGVGGVVRCIG